MRDPHVESLVYRLNHGATTSFSDPPPVPFATDEFEGVLDGGELRISMKEHFATAKEAQAVVEPFLRAWELHDELMGTRSGIGFTYEDAEVTDRDPPPPGSHQMIAGTAALGLATAPASVTLSVTRTTYPPPPDEFAVDVDVETMWNRFQAYKQGREPLQGMAYFNLSVLKLRAGDLRAAAKEFNISHRVLDTIANLSSRRGDAATARKADAADNPLTDREKAWLKAAVRSLIARAGESAGGKGVTKLTMADLPALDD